MRVTRLPLIDAKETGRWMHRIVNEFYMDMAPWSGESVLSMYTIIKDIPYRPDPKGNEVLQRPKYTMEGMGWGGDCDDKSICFAAFCKLKGIRYRFIGVGKKKPLKKYGFFDKILLTHVYTQVYLGGEWVDADCTYSFNVFGQALDRYDRIEIL